MRLPATDGYLDFSPAALVHHVDRRRPLAEVAALYGIDSLTLLYAVRNLRRDMPEFPVKRRRLRHVVYLEPTAP